MKPSPNDLELKNALSKAMWEEPDKAQILHLIDRFQDINSVSDDFDSILTNAIDAFDDRKVGREVVEYIVSKGADLNHTMNGFNCLFSAVLTVDFELVKFLLEAGADPNCISEEKPNESLLDWVEWDYCFEKEEGSLWADDYLPIIELLKKHGAKSIYELRGN